METQNESTAGSTGSGQRSTSCLTLQRGKHIKTKKQKQNNKQKDARARGEATGSETSRAADTETDQSEPDKRSGEAAPPGFLLIHVSRFQFTGDCCLNLIHMNGHVSKEEVFGSLTSRVTILCLCQSTPSQLKGSKVKVHTGGHKQTPFPQVNVQEQPHLLCPAQGKQCILGTVHSY